MQENLYDVNDEISDGCEEYFEDEETRKQKFGVKKITFKNISKKLTKKYSGDFKKKMPVVRPTRSALDDKSDGDPFMDPLEGSKEF